jgi:choline dehydrogenase-like flavoprotein
MYPFFTVRGYTAHDPLDQLRVGYRYGLVVALTAIITTIYLSLIFFVFEIFGLRHEWMLWTEIALLSLLYAPIIVALRKSSSFVLILVLMIVGMLFDLYVETHYRAAGLVPLWWYTEHGLLGPLPPLLQMLIAWFVDGFLAGPFVLWVSRIVSGLFSRDASSSNRPSPDDRQKLFPDEWIDEPLQKPKRGFLFYLLRLFGFGYLLYLIILLVGLLGTAAYPEQLRDMLEMTYLNPALMINSLVKLSLMFVVLFIGAYNKELRWYCILIVLYAHFISTIASVGLYLNAPHGDEFRDFLLMSAIIDGIVVILFGIFLFRTDRDRERFGRRKEFPAFYSLPYYITSRFYYFLGGLFALLLLGVLGYRFFGDGSHGLGAVFGFPDPQVLNTITMLSTLSFLSILLAQREMLRENLSRLIYFSLLLLIAGGVSWMIFTAGSTGVSIATRHETTVTVNWYFMAIVVFGLVTLWGLLALRKMYYNVEYSIIALNPSTARAVMALHGALYNGTSDEQSDVLERIDRHVAGVRGRRRGLLNFPFWLIEHVLSPLYGIRPSFSTMDISEQQYFLRKYILRPPHERHRSVLPGAAQQVHQIGTALHAFITLGHYSLINNKYKIGYIPPDARDRLQGDYPSGPPPFSKTATLPDGPDHPANWKPEIEKKGKPFVAPRVVTPVSEPHIPDEIDYLVIGSGAGGGVAAYRLASTVGDPSKILIVERGKRYSPLQDFNDDEMEMIRKLYKEGGLQMSKRFDFVVLQGECVGGTTVINNSICFEMPGGIKSVWEEKYDIDLSTLDDENQKIAKELEIGPIDNDGINTRVKETFEAAVKGYNEKYGRDQTFNSEILKANQRNIMGSGLCNLGNKRMRKRSVLETYIPWSEARGVRVVSNTSAVRFIKEGRRAVEVILRTNIGTMKRVRIKKAVMVAAGTIASSHFLMRSLEKGDAVKRNVGNGLSCNFAFPFVFEFDRELQAYDGVQITLGALDKNNRAVFETYFNPPGSFAISLPFYFSRHHNIMNAYKNLVNFGILVGSEPNGEISERADAMNGRAFSWELGQRDIAHIKYAFETIIRMGFAGGAKRAIVPTDPGIELHLNGNEVERFCKAINEYPLHKSDMHMMTAHPQGGNRMAGDASVYTTDRVVDGAFKVDGLDNVYVADASVFPEGITINPQWTIMSMSSLAAQKVLEQE